MKPRKQSTERLPDESDGDYYLRVLPKPPLTMSVHDDVVGEWLQDVFRIGGIHAIEWVFDTANWPLGSVARGRMLHYLGVLRQRAESQAKRQAEERAREQQEQQANAHQRARRAAGWA
jgi:hypothetical protein